jgi:hypothetical protein
MPIVTILLACATVLQVGAKADVTAVNETYKGWAGAYRLSNGRIDVVVVPQIGRIMYVGFKGGRNLLWENPNLSGQAGNKGQGEYQNFGGDKLWIAPHTSWTMPPDPDIDGGPWEAKANEDGLTLTSAVGKKWGVQFEREITLAKGAAVTIKNTITNKGEQPVELSIQEIAQVDDPSMVAVKTQATSTLPNAWYGFENETLNPTYHRYDNMSGTLFLQRNPSESRRFGGAGDDGAIESTFGTGNDLLSLRMSAPFNPSETYPDKGSAMQVFLNQDPDKFVEMSVLSPVRKVKPNQKIALNVRWQIKKLKV